MTAHDNPKETCKHCRAVDRPLLSPGTGPHAIRASCQHCGRFWRWVSILSPTERLMHRAKARALAREKRPATPQQLNFLQALGDTESMPANMQEASERITLLKKQSQL